MTTDPLAPHRAAYAHAVTARYGANDPAVEAAFAKVPREAFLGPPPWTCGAGGPLTWSRTSRPEALYQDVLVALDRAKGINNGQPSLHALCIAALHLTHTDHVLHIGAGTGYYTAILAEQAGSVDAFEIEACACRAGGDQSGAVAERDGARGKRGGTAVDGGERDLCERRRDPS